MEVTDDVVKWQREYVEWCTRVREIMNEAREITAESQKLVFHVMTRYFKNRVPRTVMLYPTSHDGDALCISKSGFIYEGYGRGSVVQSGDWKIIAGLVEEKETVYKNLKDSEHKILLRDMKAFIECFPQNIRFATGAVLLSQSYFDKPLLKINHSIPFSFVRTERTKVKEYLLDSEEAKVYDGKIHDYRRGDTTAYDVARGDLGEGVYTRIRSYNSRRDDGSRAEYVRKTPGGIVVGVEFEVRSESIKLDDLDVLPLAVEFSRSSDVVMKELVERFEEYKQGMAKLNAALEAKFGRRMLAESL